MAQHMIVSFMPQSHCATPLRARAIVTILLLLFAAAFNVHRAGAQWTLTELAPAGSDGSSAIACNGSQQAGSVIVGGVERAALWNGDAFGWVDLTPPSAASAIANGGWGLQQVGSVVLGTQRQAAFWSSSAATWQTLHPAGASASAATGIGGIQQVGYVQFLPSPPHAALWSGVSSTWVDLNPASASESHASAVANGQQVGSVLIQTWHAALWSGSASTFRDLHPPNATLSRAFGLYNGDQVGVAEIGAIPHASLWHGTASSWIDLGSDAEARAVSGVEQVGWTNSGGMQRACVWTGAPSSIHILHPPGYASSAAYAIYNSGAITYIVGSGVPAGSSTPHALLWSRASCFAPVLAAQPVSFSFCPLITQPITLMASGTSLRFNWQARHMNGPEGWQDVSPPTAPLDCGGGLSTWVEFTPSRTPGITLGSCSGQRSERFLVRCVVQNACGSVTTDTFTVSLCPANINCPGPLDTGDIYVFVSGWFTGNAPDFNQSGTLDIHDIFDFLSAWFAGCN